jgi:putative DNA primase/helicase
MAPTFANVPQDLKDRHQWVLWKTKIRAGRPTKVPYQPNGIEADSSDPKTWSTYTEAVGTYPEGGYDGIGFVFDPLDPYAGVDLDHCINADGTIKPKAKAILERLNSFSEISPSGTGVKVFLKAKNPVSIRSKDGKFQQGFSSKKADLEIEIYYGYRFFTLTGNVLPEYPATIEDRNQGLTDIFRSVFADRGYFSEQPPQREYDAPEGEPLSDDAAERLQELFAADPTFKAELCTPAPVGKRSDAEFHLCARLWEAGFSEPEIYAIMDSSPQTKWGERNDGYKRETIRKAVAKAEASHKARRESDLRQSLKSMDYEELTEGGNAQRLERIFGNEMRYNHTHKKWYLWDNGRWQVDSNGSAMRLAGHIVSTLYHIAGEADDKDERSRISGFAKKTDTRKGLSNMLVIAENRDQFAITADKLDSDAWLLGAGDVTFDLKTCTTREPRREDLITKAIGAKYDRAAKCPRWIKFIEQIFAGDKELIAYIKRAFGYCLTGSMDEQVFFFCHGDGSNGKSKFLAILRALLGEYAKQADFSTFMVQRNEKVRNDLAALAGARVITAIEAEEGGRLSMQVIKSWTGGDPITARFLFGENFTFQPTGKIWLAANNKPAISERNHAAWRRVQLIPFNVTIAENDQDKQIEAKLLKELPGILNWALDGLADYLNVGLKTPDAVMLATAKYRKENDNLELFVSECCESGKMHTCKNTDLYGAYQNFCGMSGLRPLSQTKFSPELSSRPGIKSTRNMHGITWLGIDLNKDWKICRVEPNPTSTTGDAKDVGLKQNAQSTQNSALRGDFAQNTINPTQHSDCNPTLPYITHVDGNKEDPEKERFKAKVQSRSKNTCRLCGEHFQIPLTIGYQGGYICEPCRRDGKPSESIKVDPQTSLIEVAEQAT